ncbi:MAG: hypothetical protein WAU81_01430 [Candidatus Aminicenantales bacterium]
MREIRTWAWLIFFGSLWGINEVVTGEILFQNQVFLASVWLAAWAFFILAAARGIINKPGTSSAIAGIAAAFKLVNAPPFYCHLLAIILLGVGFDAAATLLIKKGQKSFFLQGLAGILGAYGGFALFALIITYVIRYEYWIVGGTAKVINHILVDGSLAAAVSALLVPLGYKFGSSWWAILERHPRWSSLGAVAGLVLLWTLGRVTG